MKKIKKESEIPKLRITSGLGGVNDVPANSEFIDKPNKVLNVMKKRKKKLLCTRVYDGKLRGQLKQLKEVLNGSSDSVIYKIALGLLCKKLLD